MRKQHHPHLVRRTRPPHRVRLSVESLEERSIPAVDTVLTLNAGGAGSLSAVLSAAAAGDTLVFAPGLSGTITPSAVLTVANNVNIQGPGSDVISVSGGNAHQVFLINPGVSATISGLTITDGSLSTDASLNLFGGGAIDNEGNLALVNDVVSNSTAAGDFAEGGGIFSNGTLSLVNCLVSGNTASAIDDAEGGGISSFGSLSLVNCLVSGNSATGIGFARGGGIASLGQVLSVSGCTITGNQATADSGETQGGGLVDLSVTGSIVNTAFTDNTASTTTGSGGASGGGYFNIGTGTTTLTNLTFSGNQATAGGTGFAFGGGLDYSGQSGTFTNVNVTGNTASSTGDTPVAGGGASLDAPVNWTGGLVSGNTATCSGSGPALGGGIWTGDQSTLTGLTVTGNTASNTGPGKAEGGGIDVQDFTALSACTVSGNNATANSGRAQGGGIVNFGNLMVTASTIANNSASSSTGDAQGGGIWSNPVAVDNATLTVTNATLFGNSVTAPAGTASGGGLFNLGGATLVNDTLAANTATGVTAQGGGIFSSGTGNVVNTIVYDPSGAATDPDVSGTITATQNSLFGSDVAAQIAADGDLGGNQFGVNPVLGPLADNGGPTQTMALLPGSPAVDAGSNALVPAGATTDQRGAGRVSNGTVDIGAYERQATPAVTWADPADIVYGTALGAAQLDATADVPGTFTCTPAAGAVLSAGPHTLSVLFTPTDRLHYETATASVTLNVDPATPNITWADPAAIAYGTPLGHVQLNATADVPGTFTYSPAAGTVLGAGTQTLSVTFTPSNTADYTNVTQTVTLNVLPGTQTVTPAAAPSVVAILVNHGRRQRGRARSLTVVFSTAVQLDAGAFRLRRGRRPLRLTVWAQTADGQTVATLAFRGPQLVGGSLAGGRYRLAIAAGRVRAGGQALGGDAVFFFRRPGAGHGDHGADQAGAAVFLGNFPPAPGRR